MVNSNFPIKGIAMNDITTSLISDYYEWINLGSDSIFVLRDVKFKHPDLQKFNGHNAIFKMDESLLIIENDDGEELHTFGIKLTLDLDSK